MRGGPCISIPSERADAAPGAVRRDHPAAAHLVGLVGAEVPDDRGDAVGVRLAALPLPAVAQIDAGQLPESLGEDRLEAML